MSAARVVLVLVGIAVASYGGFVLVTRQDTDNLVAAAVWLAAGVVLHDAVLAPVTVLVGAGAARRLPGRWRRPAAGALVVLGPLTLLAIPVLGRFGARADNPTLLDRPYLTAWLLLVAAVAVVVGAVGFRGESEVPDGARPGG